MKEKQKDITNMAMNGIKNLKITKTVKCAAFLLSIGIGFSLSGGCHETSSVLADGAKIIDIDDMDIEVPVVDVDHEEVVEDNKKEEKVEVDPLDLIDLSEYEGNSLAYALKEAGYEYSFEARKKLAERYGIKNYQGTAAQNTELLEKLQVPVEERLNSSIIEDTRTKDDLEEKRTENNSKKEVLNNQQNTIIKNDTEEKKNEVEEKDYSSQQPNNSNNSNSNNNNSNSNNSNNQGNHTNSSGNSSKPNNPTPSTPGTTTKPSNPGTSGPEQNKPSNPSQPSHTCNFGEWYSINDELEERKCACGKKETRNHKYGDAGNSYSAAPGTGQHNVVSTQTCVNCGHPKSTSVAENCSYNSLLSTDTVNETWKCICGDTKTISHTFGSKTEQVNGVWQDITYCTNGCGYSMSAGHNHSLSYGDWQPSKLPDECRRRNISCSSCDYTDVEVDNGHSWTTIQEADPDYGEEEVKQCDDCGILKEGDEYASLRMFYNELQFYTDKVTDKSNVKIKVIGRC